MKKKISVTVSEEVLSALEEIGAGASRSAVIERALAHYVRQQQRQAIAQRDAEILDRHADALAQVALDVLEFQAPWDPEDA